MLKVGDRITWTIMDNCGKCYYCREKGLMMKCLHLKKYGHDSCADYPHFVGDLPSIVTSRRAPVSSRCPMN